MTLMFFWRAVTTAGLHPRLFLGCAPVGNQNNGGSVRPANEQARTALEQELLFLT